MFVWNIIRVISCIVSSYIYGHSAAFGFWDKLGNKHGDLVEYDFLFFGIFTISIIINCLTEFTMEGETRPTRNIQLIVNRYMWVKKSFWLDLLTWIPLHYFIRIDKYTTKHLNWYFLTKSLRIIEGLRLFDVNKMMITIRKLMKNYSDRQIKNNPILGISMDHENY